MAEKTLSKPRNLAQRATAAALALVSFAVYSLYSYYQYKHYITPSWDLGIFSQLAKAYSHFEVPIVPIKGAGFNLWGDHFHPILILLTPFYLLFPSPATLLYLQNGLVAISVYLLCRFAQQITKNLWALLLTLAYALSFGIQNAVSVQFHEVAFALPLLVMSLGNLVLARAPENRDRYLRRAVWWGLPLAFVKEDLGITVTVIGLIALIRSGWLSTARDILFPRETDENPSWNKRFSALTTSISKSGSTLEIMLMGIWGIGWSALAMSLILPFFNTGGVFDYSDRLNLAEIVGNPLQSLAQLFFPWQKSASLGLLLLTGVLAWIFSPIALAALPTLAWRFLSTNSGYWESTWHYSLVLMPIVFVALIDVIAAAQNRQDDATQPSTQAGKFATARASINRYVPVAVPALAALVALAMLPTSALWSLTDKTFATSELSQTDLNKQEIIDSIPDGSTVAADLSVLTYLIPDHTVYWIAHEGEPAPDYVVIDQHGTAWGNNPPADVSAYAANRYQHTYTVYKQVGSIYVVQKID